MHYMVFQMHHMPWNRPLLDPRTFVSILIHGADDQCGRENRESEGHLECAFRRRSCHLLYGVIELGRHQQERIWALIRIQDSRDLELSGAVPNLHVGRDARSVSGRVDQRARMPNPDLVRDCACELVRRELLHRGQRLDARPQVRDCGVVANIPAAGAVLHERRLDELHAMAVTPGPLNDAAALYYARKWQVFTVAWPSGS